MQSALGSSTLLRRRSLRGQGLSALSVPIIRSILAWTPLTTDEAQL